MNNQEIIEMCRDYMQLDMITDLDIAEALVYSRCLDTSGFIMRQDPKVVTSFSSVPGTGLNPILLKIYAGTPDRISYKMFIEFSGSDGVSPCDGTIDYIEIIEFNQQEEVMYSTEMDIAAGSVYGSVIKNGDLSTEKYKIVADIDKSKGTWRIVDRV